MKYEYEIRGFYCGRWELETTEETRKEALQRIKEYRENAPGSYKIVRVRA